MKSMKPSKGRRGAMPMAMDTGDMPMPGKKKKMMTRKKMRRVMTAYDMP